VTVQQLYSQCAKLIGDSFPDGMRGIEPPVPIKGLGFFPVTSGSFHSSALDAPLNRRVMFVGQDFGCEAYVMRCRKVPDADIKSGTGLVLYQLIQKSEIPIKECFFTNALFGVRLGKINTGRSPGWSSQDFLRRCADALRLQIDAVQPCAIICLGRAAPELLVRIFGACQPWIEKTFKQIDQSGQQLITMARPVGSVSSFTILVHPSFRRVNVQSRRFRKAKGSKAESELLAATWATISPAVTRGVEMKEPQR
jgi:uracil DNA glycosylase superfamily protein